MSPLHPKTVEDLALLLEQLTADEIRSVQLPDPSDVDDDNMRRALAALADIAAQRDADRNSALFLESVVENLPDMIFVKEAEELRFVRFNRAGEELLGFPRAAMLGRNDHDFFPKAEADFFTAKDRQVLEAGTLADIPEEPIHTAHRGTRLLHTKKIPIKDASGEARFLLGISEDITDRRAREQALEQAHQALAVSDARRAFLLSHLPGAIWTADGAGVCTSVTGRDCDALGLRVGELIGAPADLDGAARHRDAVTGRNLTWEVSSADRFFELRIGPLPDGVGSGVIGMALDVTERHKLRDARMAERLGQSQKLESLGLLAGGVAHDFNNLLMGILGNASLAMLKLAPTSPARDSVRRIERASERAAELTRQLLAFSGRGHFVVGPTSLPDVVTEMAELLELTMSKKVRLDLDLEADTAVIDADVAQMRQLIMNLITNASDAIGDEPGVVSLATTTEHVTEAQLSTAVVGADIAPGRYTRLTVQDDGCGMTAGTRAQMFEPFFTTKSDGHGLGLAAIQGIVRGHHGALLVSSTPGEGTRIDILLRTSESDATPDPGPTTDPGLDKLPVSVGAGTILVVDDTPSIRLFAQDALSMAGYTVLVAEDGREGVDLFARHAPEIDLVLLDMTMPRMSGAEALPELRRLRPDIPVLMTSGYTEADAIGMMATSPTDPADSASGFIQKPYRARTLLDRVASMLKNARS